VAIAKACQISTPCERPQSLVLQGLRYNRRTPVTHTFPRRAQKIYGPIRRVVLRRFPYLLWFVVEGEAVVILACTHGKRSRSFIRARLR